MYKNVCLPFKGFHFIETHPSHLLDIEVPFHWSPQMNYQQVQQHLCYWQFQFLLGCQLHHHFLFLLCLVSLQSYWSLQVDQPLEFSTAEEGCHFQSLSDTDMMRMTFLCHHQIYWETLAQEVNDPSVKKRSLISKTPSIMRWEHQAIYCTIDACLWGETTNTIEKGFKGQQHFKKGNSIGVWQR